MFSSMSNRAGLVFIFPFFFMAIMFIFGIAVLPYLPIIFFTGLPYIYFDKADLTQLPFGDIYYIVSEQMFYIGFIIVGIYGVAWTLWYIDYFGNFLKKEYLFKATKLIYALAFLWLALFGVYKGYNYVKTGTLDFVQKIVEKKEIARPANLGLPIINMENK